LFAHLESRIWNTVAEADGFVEGSGRPVTKSSPP
jgi:hypothetical protein